LSVESSTVNNKKKFDSLYNTLQKTIWIGNIKSGSLVEINPTILLNSEVSLESLIKKQVNVEEKSTPKVISKIDDKKSKICILELENNKWYVGESGNIDSFIKRIKSGNGPYWTRTHKYISTYKIIEKGDLKTITLETMKQFGWQNVRGYGWSQENMRRPPKALRVGALKNAVNKQKYDEFVYILKLEDNKWFLGKCLERYLDKRINRCQRNEWLKAHKMICIERFVKNGDLKALTLKYMKEYGWQNVRGYSWIKKDMKKPPKEFNSF